MDNHLFTADELSGLLVELGNRLAKRGKKVDAYIVGGAAMAIGLGTRRGTEDIDGVFRPHEIVAEEAAAMAAEFGLPSGWLNSHAAPFVANSAEDIEAQHLVFNALSVRLASPRYLLAMKMAAGRMKDHADIVALIRHLGLRDPEQIADITFAVFGDDSMTLTDPRESVLLQAREMLRLAWG